MSYSIKIPGEIGAYTDNRINNIKGDLNQPSDIDEAFRDICKLNSASIPETRALIKETKSNPMTLQGLAKACKHFGLIFILDGSMDFFCVKHQDKDMPTIDAPVVEGEEEPEESKSERFEEVNGDLDLGDDDPEEENNDEEEEDLF